MAVSKIRGNTQIVDDTIVDAQINSAAALATTKLADGAEFVKRDGSVAMTAALNANSQKVTNLATPTAATDAATKDYADGIAAGLSWKDAAKLATAAALPAVTYANGTAGVGATLTADAVGVLTVDGVATVLNDRLLVKDQAAGLQNGIYDVTTEGTAGVAFVLTRVVDADISTELDSATISAQQGTANADTRWTQTTNAPTIGTDALVWADIGGLGEVSAGTGMTKTGNTMNVIGGNGITANADDVAVNPDSTTGATVAPLAVGANGAGVTVDNSTLAHTTGTVKVANNGITGTQINSSVAGTGLTGGGGSALSISAGGVTETQLNASVAGTGLSGGGGSALAIQSVDDEIPSGLINGSNMTYTLTQTPILLFLFVNGVKQLSGSGNDFTISGNTITKLGSALVSGDQLTASFLY